jgi:hypothetical protein
MSEIWGRIDEGCIELDLVRCAKFEQYYRSSRSCFTSIEYSPYESFIHRYTVNALLIIPRGGLAAFSIEFLNERIYTFGEEEREKERERARV